MSNPGGINVVGGNLTLDQGTPAGSSIRGTTLLASSGNLTLFSAAASGEVPFSVSSPGAGYATATTTSFGNITAQNQSKIAIDGPGGGNVVIRGGSLVFNNASVTSVNSGSFAGGNISVQANHLAVKDAAQIIASTNASGNAGNIVITATCVTVDGTGAPTASDPNSNAGVTGILSNSSAGATGNSGSVNIAVTNGLTILNGGAISGSTFSAGKGGDVTVQSATLTLDGASEEEYTSSTGIYSDAETGSTGDAGNANVSVTAAINLSGGAEISADSFATGNAGEIDVHAASLSLDGTKTPTILTGIVSDALPASSGNGGNVKVTISGALYIGANAQIASSTFGSGNAGDVTVQAETLSIDGSNYHPPWQVLSPWPTATPETEAMWG